MNRKTFIRGIGLGTLGAFASSRVGSATTMPADAADAALPQPVIEKLFGC